MLRRIFCFVRLCAVLFLCFASNYRTSGQAFQTLKITDHTIDSLTILDVYEDSLGLVWLATETGLQRYNGKSIETVRHGHYRKFVHLSTSHVVAIAADLLVSLVPGKEPDFTRFENILKNKISPDDVIDITATDTAWWILSRKGVFVYTKDRLRAVEVENFAGSYSRCLLVKDNSDILLLTPYAKLYALRKEISRFLPRATPMRFEHPMQFISLADSAALIIDLYRILQLPKNRTGMPLPAKWVGLPNQFEATYLDFFGGSILLGTTSDGLWIGKPEKSSYIFKKILNGNEPHRILYPEFGSISKIHISSENNIWVIGNGELWLLKQRAFSRLSLDLPMITFEHIVFLENGKIYVDSDNGLFECARICEHEYKAWPAKEFTALQSFIAVDKNRLWISGVDDKLYYYENNKLHLAADLSERGEIIFNLFPDRTGQLWVQQAPGRKPITGLLKITQDNRIVEYNESAGFKSRMLVAKESPSGVLYCAGIGTDSYLYRYDARSDRFINLSVKMHFPHDINFEVHDLAIADDGTIWLASTAGLLRYKNQSIERIYTEELRDQEAVAVVIDRDGAVWFFTESRGIVKYDNGNFAFFDQKAGLGSNLMVFRSLTQTDDGTVWAGTRGGFFYSHPDFRKLSRTKTPVMLSVKNDNKESTSRVFPYQSNLVFDFVSLSYPNESIQYAYNLDETSNRWIDLSPNDTLKLTNLRDGDYSVKIRARQAGGYLWSDPLTYSFTINKIWYWQWWMLMLYGFLLAVLTFISVRWLHNIRLREQQKQNAILETLVAQRTRELQTTNQELKTREQHISFQNDELLAQKEELATQNEELISQREELAFQNQELARQREELTEKNDALMRSSKQKLELYMQKIIEKSEIIDRISLELETLRDSNTTAEHEHVEKFGQILQSHILTDEDWEAFKTTFNEVYPKFFASVRFRFPEITTAELRLAALMKMNLSVKEASYMLGISIESVKKSRYRLKKKLQLQEEDSLEEFIRKLA
ncbi:MAG TPA: triple tyrosine motif-containing protein [Chryseosolibacter sp.]|nr:triple tyrosine motif-containing protein [Chryseosolibacter sp.]